MPLVTCGLFLLQVLNLQAQERVAKTDSLVALRIYSLELPVPDSVALAELDKIDSAVTSIQVRMDSLKALRLPTDDLTAKLDSLSGSLDQKRIAMQRKLDSLFVAEDLSDAVEQTEKVRQEVTSKINTVQQRIDRNTSFIDSLSIDVSDPMGLGIGQHYAQEGVDTNPGISVPGVGENVNGDMGAGKTSIPGVPGANIGNEISELENKPKEMLDETGVGQSLGDVKEKVQQVGEVSEKVDAYKDDAQKIREGQGGKG